MADLNQAIRRGASDGSTGDAAAGPASPSLWLRDLDRRAFLASTLAVAGTAALAACGAASPVPSGVSGGLPVRPTLRLSGGDFGFPSPFAYVRGSGYWLMSYIYDTLLWKDSTGRELPWLATGYTRSGDGLTYTFQLRSDVRWQDGIPFTADDVVFTFDYYRSQNLSPQIFVRPIGVASVRAIGTSSVDIRLAAPTATFIGSVAGALPIVPKHIWSSISDAFHAQDPKVLVGTGPYRLLSYSRGTGAYLYAANDQYFLGRPFVRRIEDIAVGDELTALRSGAIDAGSALGPRPDTLAAFQQDPAFGIVKGSQDFTFGLYWKLGRGGALADRRFRQACARAIDRQGMVTRLLGGNGSPGNPGFLPPTNPYHVDVEQYPYDPAAANRLLDDAGYRRSSSSGPRQGPDGRPLRFALLVDNSPVPPATDIVVGNLAAVGVQVVPQAVDTPTLDARTAKGDYEMAITNYGGLGGDPDYMRQLYASGVPKRFQSVQGYVNPTFDQIANRQLHTLDETQRRSLIDQMQHIVAADLPMLPLYYPYVFQIFRRSVFDAWYFTPGGFAGGEPTAYNKQVFITGRKTGEQIRAAQ